MPGRDRRYGRRQDLKPIRHAPRLRPVSSVISRGKILDRWASIGGYVFITWKGDHPPRHVHVYRDGTLIVKWDLDNQKAMKGAVTRRILALIRELEAEGLL